MYKNIKKIDAFVLAGITLMLGAFFIGTGTIFSGYHFTDDHEIIRINNNLNTSSLFSVINQWTSNDFNIRFRPLYYPHRVLLVKLFGLNFLMWSVYYLMMLIVTFCLLYLSLRKFKAPIIVSLLFPVIAIAGAQAENWWRLGTSENIGALFLALSFYYLKEPEKNKNRANILFILFLLMAALCKESFIVVIPAILFLKIYLNTQTQKLSIKKIISGNLLLLIPLFCVVLFLYIIYFHIGINQIGYAGIESGTQIRDLLTQIAVIFKEEFYYYWILVLACFVFTLFLVKNDNDLRVYFQKIAGELFFLVLFLTPLLILYAKSGMKDRYLIPATIGASWFFVFRLKDTGLKISWQHICLYIICSWVLVMQSTKTYIQAMKFTRDGKNIDNLIQSIVSSAGQNSYVVLAFDPIASNEAGFSLKTYLESIHKIKLHAAFIDRNSIFSSAGLSGALLSNAKLWFENMMFNPLKQEEPDMVIFLDKNLRIYFFDDGTLPEQNYKTTLTLESPYCIYHK